MSINTQMLPNDAKCTISRGGCTGYIFGGILDNLATNALFIFNSATAQVSEVISGIALVEWCNLSRCLSSSSDTACNYPMEQFSSGLWRKRCQWQIFEWFVVISSIEVSMETGIVNFVGSFHSCSQRRIILLCAIMPAYVVRILFILLEQRRVDE